jgi:1,3-beta-glucan synthase
MAILFIVAYMFVDSFPDSKTNKFGPSPLLRIAVISLGPVVWNAAVLIILFLVSLFLGPMMATCYPKFGSLIASIAHGCAVVGLIAFLEFMWFLERWDASHATIGLIAVIFIQRAINKFLISVFLSREFKHDETNRAWWTGKWYGRGLGSHVMSQPAREFVVKVVEMSLWSSDFLLGHILLFMLTPPILIPFIDKAHSTMLFWLRPSKQIRAPLYSMKVRKQRRWMVIKYGIVYAAAASAFAALIVLPIIFRDLLNFTCNFCLEL